MKCNKIHKISYVILKMLLKSHHHPWSIFEKKYQDEKGFDGHTHNKNRSL